MGDLDMSYSLSFFKGPYEKWQMLISIHLEITNQGLKNQWMKIFLLPQYKVKMLQPKHKYMWSQVNEKQNL